MPNNQYLPQHQHYNSYYPNPKYLVIGYMDPQGYSQMMVVVVILIIIVIYSSNKQSTNNCNKCSNRSNTSKHDSSDIKVVTDTKHGIGDIGLSTLSTSPALRGFGFRFLVVQAHQTRATRHPFGISFFA